MKPHIPIKSLLWGITTPSPCQNVSVNLTLIFWVQGFNIVYLQLCRAWPYCQCRSLRLWPQSWSICSEDRKSWGQQPCWVWESQTFCQKTHRKQASVTVAGLDKKIQIIFNLLQNVETISAKTVRNTYHWKYNTSNSTLMYPRSTIHWKPEVENFNEAL